MKYPGAVHAPGPARGAKRKSNKKNDIMEEITVTIRKRSGWDRVLDAARITANKEPLLGQEPSEEFKRRMLITEHSPLRLLTFDITIFNIPYYAAMHLVRHKVGCEWFVGTQRSDRTGEDRNAKRQDAPVTLMLAANAAALLAISRERMCDKADEITQEAWGEVIRAMFGTDRLLALYMQPKCSRLGFCPEMDGCGAADQNFTARLREDLYIKPLI